MACKSVLDAESRAVSQGISAFVRTAANQSVGRGIELKTSWIGGCCFMFLVDGSVTATVGIDSWTCSPCRCVCELDCPHWSICSSSACHSLGSPLWSSFGAEQPAKAVGGFRLDTRRVCPTYSIARCCGTRNIQPESLINGQLGKIMSFVQFDHSHRWLRASFDVGRGFRATMPMPRISLHAVLQMSCAHLV